MSSDTKIWRGGSVSLHQLRLGDEVAVGYYTAKGTGDSVAIDIEANVGKFEGKITRAFAHGIEIAAEDHDQALGPATIFIDAQTIFNEGSLKDLKVGAFVEVIGLDLGHNRMRATRVLSLEPAGRYP